MKRLPVNDIQRAHALLLAFVVLTFAAVLMASATGFPPVSFYQPFHISVLRLCIVIDVVIFIVAWNRHGEHLSQSAILLAVTFCCIAILDFFNLGSQLGLPALQFADHVEKSAYFRLLARLLTAFGVSMIAQLSFRTVITRRKAWIMLALALLFIAAYSWLVFTGWDGLPSLKSNGYPSSPFRIFLDFSTLCLYGFACARLYQELHDTGQKDITGLQKKPEQLDRFSLFAATLAALLAQVCFILFEGSLSVTVFLAPAFKLTGAVFFYRCVMAGSIQAPYAALARLARELQTTSHALQQNQARLAGILENASDAIISIDNRQVIVLANPSAAAMFGTTIDAMQGCPIEQYIPARHHEKYRRHIRFFGNRRIAYLTKGNTYSRHTVTGLKATGAEFAIEASISSTTDNGKWLYTLILRDITERTLAQEELARSHAESRRLAKALQTAQEQERRKIASDLHDDLGQLLATLKIDLSLLHKQSADTVISPHQFDRLDTLLTTSIASLRRIATDLRPHALNEGGLYFALHTLRKNFVARHGITCDLHADETHLALDEQRTIAIYRIIQESLSNISRHANARKVVIVFQRDDATLEISIHDDGRGIRPEDMVNTGTFGLADMRERVRAMDGRMSIASSPGEGTRIDISLPL